MNRLAQISDFFETPYESYTRRHLTASVSVSPGCDHNGVVSAAILVHVADVLLGDVGILDDLGEMGRVVNVGALLQHEAGVEVQFPDVQEDGLQLLRGPIDEIAEPGR